jgi:hypothetical protein
MRDNPGRELILALFPANQYSDRHLLALAFQFSASETRPLSNCLTKERTIVTWAKFLLASLAIFIASSLFNFAIHGYILQPEYRTYPGLLRDLADSQSHTLYLILSFLIFSPAFVWIYSRGVSSAPWIGQGVRYAIAVWFIATVSRYFTYYAIQPWSAGTVLRQIFYELPMMIVLGLIVAWFFRGSAISKAA